MSTFIIIERGFAIGYLVCGLALMINPQQWSEFVDDLRRSKSVFPIAFITVFLGAFMVAGHNIWEFSPRLLTTIIAWIALFKGALFLTCPNLLFNVVERISPGKLYFRVGGLFVTFISVIILYYSTVV